MISTNQRKIFGTLILILVLDLTEKNPQCHCSLDYAPIHHSSWIKPCSYKGHNKGVIMIAIRKTATVNNPPTFRKSMKR